MKRIAVTFEEMVSYEVLIDVPDDYPETVEAYQEAADNGDAPVSGSGEADWWEKVEAQVPNWCTSCCTGVNDRELTNIERVKA